MDNYKKSNYAINKVRKGIVYKNADGSVLEVTFEKIAKDNPDFTEEDFEKLKQLSDELYHKEEKRDNLESHFVKTSLDALNPDKVPSNVNVENDVLGQDEERMYFEKFRNAADTLLTPVQKRRLYLNSFRKMTVREIAKIEGSHYTVVAESIRVAKKKLKKFLRNF